MQIEELAAFLRKNCRFKLKDGREVYGVIWQDINDKTSEYYFSSANDHRLYEQARQNSESEMPRLQKYAVNVDEIILAERLAG